MKLEDVARDLAEVMDNLCEVKGKEYGGMIVVMAQLLALQSAQEDAGMPPPLRAASDFVSDAMAQSVFCTTAKLRGVEESVHLKEEILADVLMLLRKIVRG